MYNLVSISQNIIKHSEEYNKMVEFIQSNLPVIKEATGNFCKTQSQFMDNFLTVSHPTPIRNAHQILAEITNSLNALQESQYTTKKSELKIKRLERDLDKESDEITKEELQLDIDYEKAKLQTNLQYVEGAIRKVTNYIEQYNNILSNNGIDKITEELFEAEEEKYHIMKSFNQAVCAARSRGGCVDEGNHIYFSQIGINGAIAQALISTFLNEEQTLIQKESSIDGTFQTSFLENMAKLFKGCSASVATKKGHSLICNRAVLKNN